MHHNHRELLRSDFKSLGYFADRLFAAGDDFEFFRMIVEEIVPLFKQGPLFRPFSLMWVQENKEHKKEYRQCQKQVIKQTNEAFVSLKSTLNKEGLLEHALINKKVADLEPWFANKEKFAIAPQEIKRPVEQFQQLCDQLFELGRVDLVKPYAEIAYVTQYKVDSEGKILLDPQTNKPIIYEELRVLEFTFAPAIKQLALLEEIFNWDIVSEACVAWGYIEQVEWCWNNLDDAWRQRETQDVQILVSKKIELIHQKIFYEEIEVIKQRKLIDQQTKNAFFFKRDRFQKYFKLILNAVILDQEIKATNSLIDAFGFNEPYSIELNLDEDDNVLLLNVQWKKESGIESYVLHKFTFESDPNIFFKHLMSLEVETMIVLSDLGIKAPSSKILGQAKIKGIWKQLFFKDPGERKSGGIIFRGKRVILDEIKHINFVELHKKIKELKKY